MNIIQCMESDDLFRKTFGRRGLLRRDTWSAWKTFLRVLFALPMRAADREIYKTHTQRSDAPTKPFSECWCVCGRRSGKSVVAAAVATFLSAFRDYSAFRAPGETLVLPIIAPDRRQCRTILGYVGGFFDSSPVLSAMVANRLKEAIELTSGIRIEVHTANFRTVRGYTAIGCIIDEAAFLRSEESATPDAELLAAITPSMSTIPGALLLAISSPYSRRGELWRNYKEHFGKNESPVLVWQAETRAMNPTVPRSVVDAAVRRDPASAGAEYLAQFRTDVETFLPLEVVEACVVPGRRELPPLRNASYFAFCDPSGGRSDAMTLALAHAENNVAVLDLVREVEPPFSPETVVREFADTLKRYRVFSVVGDKYGAEWVEEQFEKCGIQYRAAERTRSEIYLETLPALTSGQVELLDNARLVAQLAGLERRSGRSGRDAVDHAPNAHDDLSNAACGALVLALESVAGDVFGLLEYERNLPATELKPTTSAEPLPCCPQCGAECVTRLGFDEQFRCSQCGAQFRRDVAAEPEVVLPSRANLAEFSGARTSRQSGQPRPSFWNFLHRKKERSG